MIFDQDNPRMLDQRILTKRITGKIMGMTRSADHCPALSEISNGVNESGDLFFYEVSIERTPNIQPEYIFGFGILGLPPDNATPIDLDGNGAADSFTVCNTLEGVRFDVWKGSARQGEPLWEAYEHFGYELEGSDCPE